MHGLTITTNAMVTIKIFLDKRRITKEETCPLNFRIYYGGKSATRSTKIYLKEDQWDSGKKMIRKHSNAVLLNRRLHGDYSVCGHPFRGTICEIYTQMTTDNTVKALENAVHSLTGGHLYNVGGLTFRTLDNSNIQVTGSTVKHDLTLITRSSCILEMGDVKKEFMRMLDLSTAFKDYIEDKAIQFCLIYDYGMGGVFLCEEVNGHITWSPDVR